MQWEQPCQITKADTDREGRTRITIRASTEDIDTQGERVLKSAFQDRSMIDEFIKTGYYDYNHLTDIIDSKVMKAPASELVELQKAKARAIIGYPESLEIKADGVYSTGYLLDNNEFAEVVRNGLQSGWNGWGASISGYTHAVNKSDNTINKIYLRKIAIQPLQESVNPNTAVSISKSGLPSLIQVVKGDFPAKNLYDTGDDVKVSGMDAQYLMQLNDMNRKIDFLYKLAFNSYEFKNLLATRIEEALENKNLPDSYDGIVAYAQREFMIAEVEAKQIAEAILKITGVQ